MFRILIGVLLLCAGATSAIAQGEYRIRPGDTLSVRVLEDQTVNGSVLVLPDGSVNLPIAGSVQAGGRSVSAVETAIAAALQPNFVSVPSVTVAVTGLAERSAPVARRPATIDVFALGEFKSPGKLSVSGGTTLLQFLAESGGMTRFAATKRIQLRRTDGRTGQETVYPFNYDNALAGGESMGNTRLLSGDVIVIPERALFE
ncbi:polysaccharide biosynthesis/export family protein [Loktanella agnita]|uniref:polysaccharide biosynthesis/export family protein n=1 Tax=Loktanella agnita TaxID=287097 RepID=UPI003987B15A